MTPAERLFSRTGLIAVWALLVLAQLPIRDVMPPDEPRFAHQAQSMKSSGEWIVPYIGDSKNVDKPPVLFWSVVIASLPFDRVTATTARVPSALAALVVLLLAARLGRRLWGSEAVGYGGALITLTGVEFFQKAQWCSCDMPMAAFAWTALTCWSESLFGDPPPARPALRIALGWAAVGFGVLTKGPVALLWAVFWIVSEAIARRRLRPLLRIAWNPGVPLALAIIGGWLYALGRRAGWEFVYEATIHQNLHRYVNAWNSTHPWYFFAYQTPADLLPWIAFVPAAVALVIRRETTVGDERSTIASRATALFALFGLAFFSTSSGKRGVYVMEAFPAISLLIAASVIEAGLGGLGFLLTAAIGVALGVGAPLAAASGAVTVPPVIAAAAGTLGVAALVSGGLALGVGGAWGFALLRRGRNQAALACAAAGAIVALFLAGTIGGVTWSRVQRARPFCAAMDVAAPPGERIGVEGTKFEQFMFYTLRKTVDFNSDAELLDVLASGRCRYAIVIRDRYDRLKAAAPLKGLPILAVERISEKEYVLVGPAWR